MARSPKKRKATVRRRGAAKPAFWPDGARLAITISLMVESPAEPRQMFMAPPDGKAYPDLPAETEIQYGYREGTPRLLDLFDRRHIKCSVLPLRTGGGTRSRTGQGDRRSWP